MAGSFLTLQDWARRTYGDAAPCLATLRRWAREARIYPLPRKHGRTYFVTPDAKYQDCSHGPTKAKRTAAELAGLPVRT